jgi:hypothetical protein
MQGSRWSKLAGCLALAAHGLAGAAPAAPLAERNAIEAHLRFLADDLLEGRESGSRGYDIAAGYVAAQFAQYGLKPKGAGGGFLQPFALQSSRIVPGSAKVEIRSAAGSQILGPDDVVLVDTALEDQTSGGAPVVFIGYGITAERFGHDDYRGVDVKGKIVAVLQGRPIRFPTEEGAHFGSRQEKRVLAAKHGAVGLVTLYTPLAEKATPFAKVLERSAFPHMDWLAPDGRPGHAIPGMRDDVVLSQSAAARLFASSTVSLGSIHALAAQDKPLPHLDLNASLHSARTSVRSRIQSSNVVGMIEGSDPRLKNEYVIFSAHLDHLGQVKEKSGDKIYTGAMDNAAGVATMLETARLFAQSGSKPKRSILFVALTAEEKGLLGSDYFARNPPVPVASIVANVNLDMPLLTSNFNSVVAFGADHSSLNAPLAAAAGQMGLKLQADPWPAMGLFTRSDHYMFVRQGIPSVFLVTGTGSFDAKENAADLWKTFLATHYHQPSDDLQLPFNWDAAVRFAEVNYRIGLEIANAPARPTWNKGDFFGDTFSRPSPGADSPQTVRRP